MSTALYLIDLHSTCHLFLSISNVKINFFFTHFLLQCFPRFCSWSFTIYMYTTPLSSLISSFSLTHHLYADDTQLFFSFHSLDFDSSITHLQDVLELISSSKTVNLLTLSSSKTEWARNLDFIIDELHIFSHQISTLSMSCYHHICQLCCIYPYLNSKTASNSATSIIHSRLDYCNFLYYNIHESQLTHLYRIKNSPVRAVVKAPKSCHITLILHCLH